MKKAPVRKSSVPSTVSTGTDAKVLVVGLGISGLWTARWLIERGAHVTVSDMKQASELDPAMVRELVASG
ncbi:MAG: FAD-dependent oxidoreductase, partial [Candidatus Desulfacyla sp.]